MRWEQDGYCESDSLGEVGWERWVGREMGWKRTGWESGTQGRPVSVVAVYAPSDGEASRSVFFAPDGPLQQAVVAGSGTAADLLIGGISTVGYRWRMVLLPCRRMSSASRRWSQPLGSGTLGLQRGGLRAAAPRRLGRFWPEGRDVRPPPGWTTGLFPANVWSRAGWRAVGIAGMQRPRGIMQRWHLSGAALTPPPEGRAGGCIPTCCCGTRGLLLRPRLPCRASLTLGSLTVVRSKRLSLLVLVGRLSSSG